MFWQTTLVFSMQPFCGIFTSQRIIDFSKFFRLSYHLVKHAFLKIEEIAEFSLLVWHTCKFYVFHNLCDLYKKIKFSSSWIFVTPKFMYFRNQNTKLHYFWTCHCFKTIHVLCKIFFNKILTNLLIKHVIIKNETKYWDFAFMSGILVKLQIFLISTLTKILNSWRNFISINYLYLKNPNGIWHLH